MRSIWKGHIRFSLVTIPIQVFSAVESKGNISFKQLHNEDNGRIKYKKVCSVCAEEVPYDDIVKGFEYEKDQYVVLDKDELASVKLESNRTIEVSTFVDIGEVSPIYFEALYYIGPSENIGVETFSLFRNALLETGKAGVGRIILRDREDLVLLKPMDEGVVMYKLRYPYELRSIKDVPNLEEKEVNADQMKLAKTLINSLSKPFEEVDFTDRYRDALMDVVNDKIDGKEIVSIGDEETEQLPVVDIMDALQKSIDEAKKTK